ncbi:DUF4129 domain-containing protein [Micrococcales bacterium 31B]|nr:DUF4129 domain-containing protein [Micrococcales bacterium 31B]
MRHALMPLAGLLDPDAEEARRWAETELDTWEYQAAAGSLQNRVAQWIDSVVDRFTFSLGGLDINGEHVILGLALALIVAVALSVFVAGPARRNLRAADRARLDEASAAASASDLYRLAEAAAARGDWREYCLCGFRYLYRVLLDREIVEPAEGRTAFEVATAAAGPLPNQRELLWEAAHIFSAAAYSDHPILRAQAETLEAAMQAAETARPTLSEAEA